MTKIILMEEKKKRITSIKPAHPGFLYVIYSDGTAETIDRPGGIVGRKTVLSAPI